MYTCDICMKIFNTKYKYERHKNKKIPCTRNKLECYKCKRKFSCQQSLSVHRKKCNGIKQSELKNEEKISILLDIVEEQQKEIESLRKQSKYECEYCHRIFNHSTHKYRHIKYNCPVRLMNEQQLRNNAYENGFINDIKLRDYGEENMEWIRENIIHIAQQLSCLNIQDANDCRVTSMKYIHANDHTLENKNVRIPSKKDFFDKGLLQVWQNNKWVTKPQDEVLDNTTKKLVETLEDGVIRNNELNTKSIEKMITTYDESILEKDKNIRKKLETQIYCLLKQLV